MKSIVEKIGSRYRGKSGGGAASKPNGDEFGGRHPEGGEEGYFFSGQKRPERAGKFK
jgi:hypothetical protein